MELVLDETSCWELCLKHGGAILLVLNFVCLNCLKKISQTWWSSVGSILQ